MATELSKPISREVNIKDAFGKEAEMVVTMTGSGIEIRRKGTQRKLFADWLQIAGSTTLPPNARGVDAANHLGWLTQHEPAASKEKSASENG